MAVSDIDRAIRAARAGINDREAPIRRQLRDAYARAIDALQVDIELVTAQIRDARAAGEAVSPDWLRRQTRYRRLLVDAEREFARFTDDGLRILRQGQVAAVSGGAAEAWELMEAAGIDIGFGGRVNTQAVENLVSATDPASPLRGVLDSYGENGVKVIEETLTQGLIKGTGPREIARQIRRGLMGGGTGARLDALIRTELMRSYRASLNEQYDTVSHLIRGYRWTAAHSRRTCLACLARSGKVRKEPWDQMHPQCRCINTPVPIGSDFTPETGEDWLRRQAPDVQRDMFPGKAAYDLWKSGNLSLEDFVGVKRSKVWGTSIYERSGRQALQRADEASAKPTRPPFVAAKNVAEAKRKAAEFGIDVTGISKENLVAANLVNEAAEQLIANGNLFPYRIAIKKQPAGNKAMAQFNPKGKRPLLEVFADTEFFTDPDGFAKLMFETNVMASPDAAGLIRHEMAHGFHYKGSPYNLLQIPLNPEQTSIAMQVSRYAATSRPEFVAETYAGLTGGRTFSDEVMDLYREWKGPTP